MIIRRDTSWINTMRSQSMFSLVIPCAVLLTGMALPPRVGAAATGSEATDDFAACVAALQARAQGEGIDENIVREILGSVERQERIIELDRRQPEFTASFADYLNRRVTPERVAQGRQLLSQHRELFTRVQAKYGVPAHYLLAFWGLETNFGSYFGNIRVPDSLATLACDPRRSSFFSEELLAALRILEAGDIDAQKMLGSWAGAMGHMQFLPSVFLRHAVDGDADGRRDIWGSLPDALSSAGNFLQALGWESGLRWGREIHLPSSFDYSEAGPDERRPLAEWVRLGITDAHGNRLPALDLPASILVPAGHDGPAFLVYRNFDVIMGWNRSEFYALAVGHLADRIAGGGALVRPPADSPQRVSVDEVRQLQEDLAALGYPAGEPDGIPGPATRKALRTFQRDHSLVADGYVDVEMLAAVREAAKSHAL